MVGSLDCLSSVFYAALSAVGFAYSLSVLIPGLGSSRFGIILVAIAIVVLMGLMHLRGVSKAGNLQIVLGLFLVIIFGVYVYKGLTSEFGFSLEVFQSGRSVFENQSTIAHIGRMLTTIALVYNAYLALIIADDAEGC